MASVDLLALARSLRCAGAPITPDDIVDALIGLGRLGSADPELVSGVLDATLGKYGPAGRIALDASAVATSSVDDEVDRRDVAVPSESSPPSGHGDETDLLVAPNGSARAARSAHDDGQLVAVDGEPDARSLGAQVERAGSSREHVAEILGAVQEPTWQLGLRPPSGRPQTWSGQRQDRATPASAERRIEPATKDVVHAIRSLARSWDGGGSRMQPARTGSIDVRRTLLAACRSAGPLLPPARRRRGHRRPAGLVVVDLSPSVRESTPVSISIAHRLARTGRRIRVLAATDRLIEVTSAFRRPDPIPALARMVDSGQLDPTVGSDWGRVLRELERCVSTSATAVHVLVLGDGRSCGAVDGVVSLERLSKRAASLRWATPEPQGAWALGSGEPARYAQVVGAMVTVRAPADLAVLSGARGSARTK